MLLELPWIFAALTAALVVLTALLAAWAAWAWWQRRARREEPLPQEWPLDPRPVFSADERRIYRQLREALPHHVVLAKLPLVRFCQPREPSDVRRWYGLIGGQSVAFAICSANGRVLAAIDLEEDRRSSRRSLEIKQAVLAACRVRYLRCPPDHLPSVPELQVLVPGAGAMPRGPMPVPNVHDGHFAPLPRRDRGTLWRDSTLFGEGFYGRPRTGAAPAVRREAGLDVYEQPDGPAGSRFDETPLRH
jgi:hypothetical protein